LPFIKLPQIWQGITPLKSGSVLELITPGRQTIALPNKQGLLTLQGPAALELKSLSKTLLTGRTEADLTLNFGRLHMVLDPAAPKFIQIQTPLLTTRVTGTHFFLSHHPEFGTYLMVLKGQVYVRSFVIGTSAEQPLWEALSAGIVLRVMPDHTVHRGRLHSTGEGALPTLPLRTPSSSVQVPSGGAAPQGLGRYRPFLWFEESKR